MALQSRLPQARMRPFFIFAETLSETQIFCWFLGPYMGVLAPLQAPTRDERRKWHKHASVIPIAPWLMNIRKCHYNPVILDKSLERCPADLNLMSFTPIPAQRQTT